jgi:hypothetical protein
MPNFNLIPPEEKEKLEKIKKINLIRGILKLIVIILIAFCLLLLSTNFSLSKIVKSQKDSLDKLKEDPIMKQILSLDTNITSANSTISEVYKAQKGLTYFSPTIEKIIGVIPNGVYITELKIELKTQGQEIATSPTQTQTQITASPTVTQPTPTGGQKTEVAPPSFWEVNMAGHADTRDQVILIEEALKKTPEFSHITSPLQNIIKPTDISFNFIFRLKK